MTELLQRAIAKLNNLPEDEQDAVARMILEEIEDELKWEQAFSRSSVLLAQLAASAMSEYQAGKTKELDPETL